MSALVTIVFSFQTKMDRAKKTVYCNLKITIHYYKKKQTKKTMKWLLPFWCHNIKEQYELFSKNHSQPLNRQGTYKKDR